ncbi:MAG: EAL domain-containing protein [Burkholderiaceae bacterium]
MRLRSLESRIVLFFLFLILAVQLAGFFAIRADIRDNARASIGSDLVTGERVFRHLLEQKVQALMQSARLLAQDAAFGQAVIESDHGAISTLLDAHGATSGAALTLLVSPDRRIQAAAGGMPSKGLERALMQLVDDAEQNGQASGIALADRRTFQIAALPVKAPTMTGWVVLAAELDGMLAANIGELTALQFTVLTRAENGSWQAGVSSLDDGAAEALAQEMQRNTSAAALPSELQLSDGEYGIRIFRLAQNADHTAVVVLQEPIEAAVAPYRRLQTTLLLLTAVGIALALIGSIVTARRITGPLRQLAESAKRLGSGDYYQGGIDIERQDEIGELSRAFSSMREGIANRELEIRRLAYWDSLTGLPNRAQFVTLLDSALAQARKYRLRCHVLMMDLDRFKHVNDVLGHSFGDALLRQVAQRLTALKMRNSDQIARLGGDEFALLLPDSQLDEVQTVAARILESLEEPLSLEDQTIDLGASIGIAGFPEHGHDAESLLSRAEVAMYAAKHSGNEAVVYEAAIDKTSQDSLSLLGELRRALDHGEFRLHVQPKAVLKSGKVVGVEALVRWLHPKRGMIQPDHFIPFAEKTGFIRLLTRWVLEQAAAQASQWQARGLQLKISVNLSTRDLLDQDLPAKFVDILTRHQVPSSSFCLEITESAIMDDPVRAQQTLERLYAMGVELSIDDFGTGYSSLSYLKRLPVHELKIDKSFVMSMEHDVDDATIVRSTVDLGHNMGLRVVAEGVESGAVLQMLARMGCDQAQGYFVGCPMPAEDFPQWQRQWAPPLRAVAEKMI